MMYVQFYGLMRKEWGCILETFPIGERMGVARYGEYRTARLLLGA